MSYTVYANPDKRSFDRFVRDALASYAALHDGHLPALILCHPDDLAPVAGVELTATPPTRQIRPRVARGQLWLAEVAA